MRAQILLTMNTRFLLCLFYLLVFEVSFAQVGINTKSPQGIFHIDVLGDTDETSNKMDDLIIETDGGDGINMSLSGIPNKSASLSLNAPNKALRLNQIKLNSPLGSDPLNSIKNPTEGMLIYNTVNSGVYPDNVRRGPYIFKGGNWQQLMYFYDNTDMGKFVLEIDNSSIKKCTKTSFDISDFLTSATLLNFRKEGALNVSTELILTSNAAYGVALDFVGSTTNTASKWALGSFYVAAVDVTDSSNPFVLDIVQITPVFAAGNSKTVYSTILGFNGDIDTKISIMICQSADNLKGWALTAPSSGLIWRL